MRVGIIQSGYIPWRGYFDFINSVDLFIILDDVAYPRGRSWRNRNQIKTQHGLKWINIPLMQKPYCYNIDQVKIIGDEWKKNHYKIFSETLRDAKYFDDVKKIFKEAVSYQNDTLSELNYKFIELICDYLKIKTEIIQSKKLNVPGSKTNKIINLLKEVGATIYLSGPSASNYLDRRQFMQSNISLEFKVYEYCDYPQLWGEFEGSVTIFDLIANCGSDSVKLIKSNKPNIVDLK